MASFEVINYNLRPNKSIERKMICEVISRLSIIEDINSYRYIGMGSAYFTDFILFHKNIGFKNMISIESELAKKDRFEFNKPYACIDVRYGYSNTILPNLELDNYKNVIWLDYDGVISTGIFSDIDTIVSTAKNGSMFLISLNVEPSSLITNGDIKEGKDIQAAQKENLISIVGNSRIPAEYSDIKLSKNKYIELVHKMIDMQINESLTNRNGTEKDKSTYFQIFNIQYKDGATMLTIGGIILSASNGDDLMNKMQIKSLPFYRNGNDFYKIKCPNLTYKEVNALNSQLPCEINKDRSGRISNKGLKNIPLSATDIEEYCKIYRYYPAYQEVIL